MSETFQNHFKKKFPKYFHHPSNVDLAESFSLSLWGRYAHRVHRASHRVRTACVLFIIVSKIFSDFSGCQGRGGLRGKHTTTEASTPSSSPIAWWL